MTGLGFEATAPRRYRAADTEPPLSNSNRNGMTGLKLFKPFWPGALCLALNFHLDPLQAAQAQGLRISQFQSSLPAVVGYADVHRSEIGKDLSDPALWTVTIGDARAKIVDAKRLDDSGAGVAYLMLVNLAKPLPPERFESIRLAIRQWQEVLGAQDRMALVGFGDHVREIMPFSADKQALRQALDALQQTDTHSGLHEAVVQATQTLQAAREDLPSRRVIVVFSDGVDDLAGDVTRQAVLERIKAERVPIYAIGLASSPPTPKTKVGLTDLRFFARLSGGEYLALGDQSLEATAQALRQHIRQIWRLQLECEACRGDGRLYHLQLSLSGDNQTLTDGLELRLLPPVPRTPTTTAHSEPEQPKPQPGQQVSDSGPWLWMAPLGGSALALTGAAAVWRRARPKTGHRDETAVDPPPVPAPAAMKLLLTEVQGQHPGQTYPLELHTGLVLGRSKQCALMIDDQGVSSRHCALTRSGEGVYLQDLHSTHGTFVNGVPIQTRQGLQNGDHILLGGTELRVQWETP